MKLVVVKIKHYHLKNTLKKLNHTKIYHNWSQKIRYIENSKKQLMCSYTEIIAKSSLLFKYPNNLEKSMKDSRFIFDCDDLLRC